ncbi:hypothetical protein [Streptosporangium sp. CA-115845]|uniref:hypothetical protein n=1 Tax=Streptosporangium sp. CA-115845 TaxID=3240071 RepID=UPI003D93BC08
MVTLPLLTLAGGIVTVCAATAAVIAVPCRWPLWALCTALAVLAAAAIVTALTLISPPAVPEPPLAPRIVLEA